MKVDLFAICEGAYNHNGSLTIVEAFDQITVPSTPIDIPVGIAFKLSFDPEENGEHNIDIIVTHQKDNNSPTATFSSKIVVPSDLQPTRMVMALNIRGFKVPVVGKYNINVLFDKTLVYNTDFNVVVNGNN